MHQEAAQEVQRFGVVGILFERGGEFLFRGGVALAHQHLAQFAMGAGVVSVQLQNRAITLGGLFETRALVVHLAQHEVGLGGWGRSDQFVEGCPGFFGLFVLQVRDSHHVQHERRVGILLAQRLQALDGRGHTAGIELAGCQKFARLQVAPVGPGQFFEQGQSVGIGFLFDVDQPQVQHQGFVLRNHTKSPLVRGNGFVGPAGSGVDHAEISQGADMVGSGFEHLLEARFSRRIVAGGQCRDGLLEHREQGIGGAEQTEDTQQAQKRAHMLIMAVGRGEVVGAGFTRPLTR